MKFNTKAVENMVNEQKMKAISKRCFSKFSVRHQNISKI